MTHKDDPYYLGNCDCKPTVLTLKTEYRVIEQELPWDASVEDLIQAFYTAMVGATYPSEGVLEAMKEYAEERLPEQPEEE